MGEWDLHAVEEDLVQLVAVEGRQRADRHAGALLVDDQQRESAAAALLGARATEQPQVVGVLGVGLPALLTVDHVGLALASRATAQARQVRAGLGLGVGEREVQLAALDRGQPALPLGVVAVAGDRLGHDARGERWSRGPRVGDLVPQDVLGGTIGAGSPLLPGQPSESQPRSPSAWKKARTAGQRWPCRKKASRSRWSERKSRTSARKASSSGEKPKFIRRPRRARSDPGSSAAAASRRRPGAPPLKSGCCQCSRSRAQACSRAAP